MSNLLSIVFPCCAYVSSVMRSSWHFSSSGFNIRFPRTPQNENKNLKKCSSDYFHILHIVELWCDFKKFVGPWSIYIFIKCLWVLLTNVFWFRATGGYICGCGRPSNLVDNPVLLTNPHKNVWQRGTNVKIFYTNLFNNPVDSVIRTRSWGTKVYGLVRKITVYDLQQ